MPVVILSADPDRRVRRKLRQRRIDRLDEPGADDHMLGRNDPERVDQRVAGKVCVDQRHDPADPRDPQPHRHIFRAIAHHQADDVARPDALALRPTRIPVHPFRQRPIGQGFPLADQRGLIRKFHGNVVDGDRQGDGRVLRDRGRRLQGPDPRIARQPIGFDDRVRHRRLRIYGRAGAR